MTNQRRKSTRSAPVLARAVRGFVSVLSWLPTPVQQWVGTGIGLLLLILPNRLRQVSRRNIVRCFPDLSEPQQRTLVRRSLVSTGTNVAEAGAMWKWSASRLRRLEATADNEELLHRGMEAGRGVLLLAPHVGNWEFVSHFLMRRYPLLSLYRPPRILELDELIQASRQRLGAEMVAADGMGLRTFVRALGSGRLVAILPDQEPLKSHGVFAPFFGVDALTMTLVRSLVRRYQPAVVFAFAERVAGGRFRVRFLEPPEGLDHRDPVVAASRLNAGVETCVRLCPDQYMWSYRRFRTRPPAEQSARRVDATASTPS